MNLKSMRKLGQNIKSISKMDSSTKATWIASVVALFSLILSIYNNHETNKLRLETRKENIRVKIESVIECDGLLSIKKPIESCYHNPQIDFIIPWEVTLSNTGTLTTSITRWTFSQSFIAPNNENNCSYFCGDINAVQVVNTIPFSELPLNLPPGESIKIRFLSKFKPGKVAKKFLLNYMEKTKESSWDFKQIQHELAFDQQIDIFDRPLTFVSFPLPDGATYAIGYKDKKFKNKIVPYDDVELQFQYTTAKGNQFECRKSWYDHNVLTWLFPLNIRGQKNSNNQLYVIKQQSEEQVGANQPANEPESKPEEGGEDPKSVLKVPSL